MKQITLIVYFLLLSYLVNGEITTDELERFNHAIELAFESNVLFDDAQTALKKLAERKNITQEECDDAIRCTNAYANKVYLSTLPPAKAVPLLSALLENDELIDRNVKIFDGKYGYPYYVFVNAIIAEKLSLLTIGQDYVTMSWFPKDVWISKHQMIFFWNYIGLKYLPVLWNDWYTCWKLENKREKPREEVLTRLAQEISLQFGNNLFPLVADAVKNGDKTLQPLIDLLPHDGGYQIRFCDLIPPEKSFTDSESFLQWWEENQKNYIYEYPRKSLESLKHIFERKAKPSVFDPQIYKNLVEMKKAIENYCNSDRRAITNCWFYKLEK